MRPVKEGEPSARVAGEEVPLARGGAAHLDAGGATDPHPVEAIRKSVKAGDVGAEVVALDAVRRARPHHEHAVAVVAGYHVACGRIRTSDQRVRGVVELHPICVIRDGVHPGRIGPDEVALDPRPVRAIRHAHAAEVVVGDHISRASRGSSDERVRGAMDLDAVEGVPEPGGPVGVQPDEVALDRGVLGEDKDPIAAVARHDVSRPDGGPADEIVGPAVDGDAAPGVSEPRRAGGVRPDVVALDPVVVTADADALIEVGRDHVPGTRHGAADGVPRAQVRDHAVLISEGMRAAHVRPDVVALDAVVDGVGTEQEHSGPNVARNHVPLGCREAADEVAGASGGHPRDVVAERARPARVGADEIAFDVVAGGA